MNCMRGEQKQQSERIVREAPDDGHVLLMLGVDEEKRTFTDYPDIISCLDNISDLYEKSRVSKGQETNFNLDQLCEWINGFQKFILLIFDKEIGRYKELNRQEVKEKFIDQLQKLEDETNSQESVVRERISTNGVSNHVNLNRQITNQGESEKLEW